MINISSKILEKEALLGNFLEFFHLDTLKDTHRGKSPSNKILELRKSTNMGVWVVGTLNQSFIERFLT